MDLQLTNKAQEALSAAVRSAAASGHPQVEPAHLLLALAEQTDTTAGPLLDAVGSSAAVAREAAERVLKTLPTTSASTVSYDAPVPERSPGGSTGTRRSRYGKEKALRPRLRFLNWSIPQRLFSPSSTASAEQQRPS